MKRWTLVLEEVCIRPASKHDDAPATLSPSGRLGARARRRARRRRDAVSRAVCTANDANARARHIARDDVTAGRRNDARGSVCGVPRFELEARPARALEIRRRAHSARSRVRASSPLETVSIDRSIESPSDHPSPDHVVAAFALELAFALRDAQNAYCAAKTLSAFLGFSIARLNSSRSSSRRKRNACGYRMNFAYSGRSQ